LLDVNVLIALVRPQQADHGKVGRWFRENRGKPWATCPLTEAGFVRVVSNPKFTTAALSMSDVLAMLTELRKLPGHQFWPLDLDFVEASAEFEERFYGHQQVTDLYLLALSVRNRGKLATLDRGIGVLAGQKYAKNVALL
jgi:toxin-antitoxin system PIN domain toxin